MTARVWTDRWEFIRDLGSGGHGHAKLVQDERTGQQGALKLLIDNAKQERRDRLHNEAIALEVLDYRRLPKLLDHNVEHRADKTVELYIVTEFIPGQVMSDLPAPCALEDALACVEAVLDTVEYCHARNVKHRDLKPNNVILRNGEIRDPVVIDFGQSFNEHEAAIMRTEHADGLGNRCMHLPELQPGSADKRNELTDISFCAGLLFWLITHSCPRELGRDHYGKYPYEREPAASILRKFPEPVRRQLVRFFTMGLARGYEERIPSIDSFREKLASIREPGRAEAEESVAESLERVLADVEQDSGYLAEQRKGALKSALWDSVAALAGEINKIYVAKMVAGANRDGTDPSGVFHVSIGVQNKELQRGVRIRISGQFVNNQFMIGGTRSPTVEPQPLAKIDVWDPEFKLLIRSAVQRIATDLLKAWLLNQD